MLLESQYDPHWVSPWKRSRAASPPLWTVLVPFFNERDFLDGTLASLAAQDMPFDLILIDNGSTDGSGAVAATICARLGLTFTLLVENRPGKVNALRAGVKRTRTHLVATCDADTLYPRDYLRQAGALLARNGAVAGGAYFVAPDADAAAHAGAAKRMARAALLLPGQCHTGGAGQVFRTEALRRAGQFDALRWGYVLEDHEIMHRMAKLGPLAYGGALWCAPSPRERDRDSIRWTLSERLLYHATPGPARDWFFYTYLARRLAARRLTSDRIRERQVQAAPDCAMAVSQAA
ncbi:glycosyltransferase family 2 protein [Sphingomonas sp. RB3P16]|uniref:glycosyltransferase n=1 Tax=Parasphingomonas frigoris TaxID=3096163 RepID=UPI002FC70AF7